MAKNAAFTVRISDEIKQAAEKAAREDHRTVASLIEMVLVRYLRERGFLRD